MNLIQDRYQAVAETIMKCFLCSLSYAHLACERVLECYHKFTYKDSQYIIIPGCFLKIHKQCPSKTFNKITLDYNVLNSYRAFTKFTFIMRSTD